MVEKIENVITEVEQFLLEKKLTHEDFRLKYLSRKGVLNELIEDFKKVSGDQ